MHSIRTLTSNCRVEYGIRPGAGFYQSLVTLPETEVCAGHFLAVQAMNIFFINIYFINTLVRDI